MILLSGMHLSVAMHLCGGEVSQVKFSFSHEKAICGMCGEENDSTATAEIDTIGCCKDEMSFYVVDSNYIPSIFKINQPVNLILQVFDIPKTIGIQSIHSNSFSDSNFQPSGYYIASAVSLTDICVFRI